MDGYTFAQKLEYFLAIGKTILALFGVSDSEERKKMIGDIGRWIDIILGME